MFAATAEDCVVGVAGKEGGIPVGTGFLVAQDLLVSCDHVVDDAIAHHSLPLHIVDTINQEARQGRLVSPDGLDDPDVDIALIELDRPFTHKRKARLLRRTPLVGTLWSSFGYPTDFPKGGPIELGRIGPETGERFFTLLDVRGEALFVEAGFSGAPVFDPVGLGVVGMISEVVARPQRRIGLMIPTSILASFDRRLQYTTVSQELELFGRSDCERLVQLTRRLPIEAVSDYLEELLNEKYPDPGERYWIYCALGQVGGHRAKALISTALVREELKHARQGALEAALLLGVTTQPDEPRFLARTKDR
jgi:hypothetical protein